jgi:two-component system, chemotaxis family, CheB/CheR fusion protein
MTTPLAPTSGGWSEFHQVNDSGAKVDAVTTDLIEILEAVDLPIVVIRSDFIIAFFNQAAADELGLTRSDIGCSLRTISVLSGLPNLERWCAQVISAKIPTQHDIRDADRSFVLRIAPHKKCDGQISGTVLTFTNVTAFRASIDQAIYEREYTKAILNTVADPLVVLGADLHVQTANRAFYLMFRVSREAIQGAPLDQLSNRALDVPHLLTQLKETIADGRSLESFEVDCDVPEIGRRTLLLNACRFAVPGPSARMALLSFHDITAHKKAEERMLMLAHEVDHRAKNQLTILQAMVHFTQGESPGEIKAAIDGRIRALSNAHTLLAQSHWTGADLRSLVKEELSPYCLEGTSRAVVHGCDLLLQPQSAQLIAMVLHELATNAVKYGALSVPPGRVRIEWLLADNGKLVLRWTETDGPAVKPPMRQGFGTRLLDQVIHAQLKGETRFDWRAEGLVCEIELQP